MVLPDSLSAVIPDALSGLLRRYHDRYLADGSLSDLDTILICTYLIESKNVRTGVSYEDCKSLFKSLGRKEVNFKANIYLAKKQDLLVDQGNGLLTFTSDGLRRLQDKLGLIEKSPVHVIKSGQNFSAIKLLEEFIVTEVNEESISLCDSHISAATLFPFSTVDKRFTSIRILTSNIHDFPKFQDYMKKFTKETGALVEVRVSNKIHDRYLISGKRCWSIGASIKDLGNKDTVIRETSELSESMTDLFNERWDEATPI